MKPTKALTLIIDAVLTAVLGFFAAKYMIASGHAVPIAELNTLITLPALGGVLIALAWPVIRYRRQLSQLRKSGLATAATTAVPSAKRPQRVDPFYAVRLLALSKASSIAGAAFAGWHLGLVLVQLSNPAGATRGVGSNVIAIVGAIVLTACALVVEFLCRIPEDGETAEDPESKTARGGSEAAAA